jgi:hypothetical protein
MNEGSIGHQGPHCGVVSLDFYITREKKEKDIGKLHLHHEERLLERPCVSGHAKQSRTAHRYCYPAGWAIEIAHNGVVSFSGEVL